MVKSFLIKKKRRLEDFLRENRTYAMPLILLVGFILDNITLRQIDRVFDNVVLLTHVLIVAVTIALLLSRETRFGKRFNIDGRRSTISALMLFSFGGLFSGFVVFYSRSGSLISSWPFILVMILLMIGTEVQKKYYENFILQITIFYIAVFSYLIFSVPIVVKKMGPEIYLLSGVISIIFIVFYIFLLKKIHKLKIKKNIKKIFGRVFIVFLTFNFLYFTNIIPPIPLSLKFSSVYHDFSRIQGVEYRGFYEPSDKFVFWKKRSNTFNRFENESVFVYSQIYAPVNLNIDIYHKWEYFDRNKTRWVTTDEVKIPITGGRLDGYRGFSKKTNISEGFWRVRITTDRNQTIGQVSFKVIDSEIKPVLVQEIFK